MLQKPGIESNELTKDRISGITNEFDTNDDILMESISWK